MCLKRHMPRLLVPAGLAFSLAKSRPLRPRITPNISKPMYTHHNLIPRANMDQLLAPIRDLLEGQIVCLNFLLPPLYKADAFNPGLPWPKTRRNALYFPPCHHRRKHPCSSEFAQMDCDLTDSTGCCFHRRLHRKRRLPYIMGWASWNSRHISGRGATVAGFQ
jgi:hypothetical protein